MNLVVFTGTLRTAPSPALEVSTSTINRLVCSSKHSIVADTKFVFTRENMTSVGGDQENSALEEVRLWMGATIELMNKLPREVGKS